MKVGVRVQVRLEAALARLERPSGTRTSASGRID